MKTTKDSPNENFSLEWSPYPPEPLIRPDKKFGRIRDIKRKLMPERNERTPLSKPSS